MHALVLSPASDRATIDRRAVDRVVGDRVVGDRITSDRVTGDRAASERAMRIEILAPAGEGTRAGARRYEEAATGTSSSEARRSAARWARSASQPAMSMRFVAQFVAQQQPGNAAHVENWRGARAAYASADALGAGRGGAPSVSIVI